jgi:ribosome biogenesis GTPase / thiamine phosphate phosphatase
MGGNGIVLANFGRSALVQTDTEAVHCGIRGRQLRVVCGDRVRWQRPAPGGAAAIQDVEARTNVLERIDSRGRGEAVAANIQRLAIVIAPEPTPDWFILDRYLASARLKDIPALLILNKCDLDVASIAKDLTVYRRLEIECHEIIAKRAETLAPLRASIQGGATMLVGQSGVGKSSMINALIPDAAAQTSTLSRDAEGRHTTTTARRYQLDANSSLIDAPGVRDFAPPAGYDRAAEHGFVEIRAAGARCKFNDCRHFDEPHCAVRADVAAGLIDARRYESYRRLLRLFESFEGDRNR